MQTNQIENANSLISNGVTLEDIKELGSAAEPCLTIMMPLAVAPAEIGQNTVRLKQAMECARRHLGESVAILEFFRGIAQQPAGPRGLAIFCSPNLFRAFYVRKSLPDFVAAGKHFHITPILPQLNADPVFYVLALSQKNIRLLRCTEDDWEEIRLPERTPKTLEEDAQLAQPDHNLANNMTGGPSTGSMRGVVFTTSTDREHKDEYLLKFYKHVSQGLCDLLRESAAPVVIAGVDYEIALFRRVNLYPHLAEESVFGAADGTKAGELHRRAVQAVKPFFEAALRKAVARFERQEGGNRTSTTIKKIVKAAGDGRVADLFVAEDAQYSGSFDERTHDVRKHAVSGEENLLDVAALQTILHGGEVFVLSAGRVPHGAPAAARLRY